MNVRFPINHVLCGLSKRKLSEMQKARRLRDQEHFCFLEKPLSKHVLEPKDYLTNYLTEYFN